MQAHIEEYDDEGGPLTEGEYEEGLDDDDDDDYEAEEYDEAADLLDDDDDEDDDEEAEQAASQGFIRGLEPVQSTGEIAGQPVNRRSAAAPQPWRGLDSLPVATREKFVKLLSRLRAQEKKELTILVIGKYFTGKSITINNLLNEEAAKRSFLNRDAAPPSIYSREAHNFTLTFIDASGLNDADVVSQKRLQDVANTIQDRKVDVVLYMDRFDLYRVDGLDEQVFRGITNKLGAGIWKNTILGLSFAGETINGYSWEEFAAKRSEKLRQALRQHGKCAEAQLPVVYVENSLDCPKNDDGERVLPNGTVWVPDLMEKAADVATSTAAFSYDAASVEKATNPNKRGRWLIPVIFAAQIAFKVFVFDRFIKDDYITGDKYGPYDPNLVRAQRARQAIEREGRKKRQAGRKPAQRAVSYYDSDSD